MKDNRTARAAGMLGLGLDHQDGHLRVTRGKNFRVFLGSEETHERLTETCIKINERLDKQGRSLGDLSRKEFSELVSEVQ